MWLQLLTLLDVSSFFLKVFYTRPVYMELDCSYKPPVKNKKSGWVVQIKLLCDCKTTHAKFHNL